MSDIARLLRVASRRNRADEYTHLRIRMLKTDLAELRLQLDDDRITANTFFEAVIRRYIGRDPGILAIVDDCRREADKSEKKAKRLQASDLDDIYAAVGGGTIDEEGD